MPDSTPSEQPRNFENNLPPWAIWAAIGGAILFFVVVAVNGNSGNEPAQGSNTPAASTASDPQVTQLSDVKAPYLIVVAGAPVCATLGDAIRISAVVNMNNDMALHSILGKTQCDLLPKDVPLKQESVHQLQYGVATVTLNNGTFYFPANSTEVRMLSEADIARMASESL